MEAYTDVLGSMYRKVLNLEKENATSMKQRGMKKSN